MGAIVNRELKQRIRPINGITAHTQVAKQDIKHAAKVIQNLDAKINMWDDTDEEKKDQEKEASRTGGWGGGGDGVVWSDSGRLEAGIWLKCREHLP